MSEANNESKRKGVPVEFRRYSKQIRFKGVGESGQQKLRDSKVLVIGCGALGSSSSNLLVRAGVGNVLIVDRDFVEVDNLQRQILFDECDIGQPKAIVAAEKLKQVNSEIEIEGRVVDVTFQNIESLLLGDQSVDVVIDATDNFEVRFLINDACIKNGIPWIYGGCLGAEGQVMSIIPGETACLNCLMLDGPPPPGTVATCDTGGILATIIQVVSAIQVNESIKYLTGNRKAMSREMQVFDLWGNRIQGMQLGDLREKSNCPTCQRGDFQWLSGEKGSQSVVLCGRNAVQLSLTDRSPVDLTKLAERFQDFGQVEKNPFLVRLSLSQFVITVFQDGRAIIQGTEDLSLARKIYTQYIGA
ncbi:MAG: ThiF family adenylyltransferase [Planctomycetota bacterium]